MTAEQGPGPNQLKDSISNYIKGLTGTEKECYHYYLEESRISLKESFSAHFLSVKKSLEPMVN